MSDSDFVIPFDQLPDRFAESLENPPEDPVPARPAATIVLMRDGQKGMETLLMRRSRRAGFVPGAYVFPGGRVDGTDATEEVLARMDGLSAASAASRLGLEDADPPAIAYYLAAIREAFEEAGILVGDGDHGPTPNTAAEDDDVDQLRRALMDDDVTFAGVLDSLGCRIDGSSIEYLAHWITPLQEHRRYDTRFFAAKVRQGALPIVDPREMSAALWITPEAALQRLEEETLPMVFPTIKTLEQLSGYPTADAALDDLAGQEIRTILPTLVVTPTGVGMNLGDDED